MSQKEQYSSLERGPKKRQDFGVSDAADRAELDRIDRELDRLFKEFWESPGRARPRNLTQEALVRPGCDTVASGSNATDDLSAE
jgi:hypothetical protein